MKSSPIERAARAFALAASGVDEWDTLDASTQQRLKDAVCAALMTMRDPDTVAVRAGARETRRTYRNAALQAEAIWQAMMTATVEIAQQRPPQQRLSDPPACTS